MPATAKQRSDLLRRPSESRDANQWQVISRNARFQQNRSSSPIEYDQAVGIRFRDGTESSRLEELSIGLRGEHAPRVDCGNPAVNDELYALSAFCMQIWTLFGQNREVGVDLCRCGGCTSVSNYGFPADEVGIQSTSTNQVSMRPLLLDGAFV